MTRMPSLFIPHGGGPAFFMNPTMGPPGTWDGMMAYLRAIPAGLPRRPTAILVVSAHWEEGLPTVLTGAAPPLLYDYYGFPDETYALKYPAPGAPDLARRTRALLAEAGIESGEDSTRGFDHGVFIPLLVMLPAADIPITQISLRRDLDPAAHLAIGRALAPLRDEGVLILGSGMSYHNLRDFFGTSAATGAAARQFDDWLDDTIRLPEPARADRLIAWTQAPQARRIHPREDHLIPLMVAAGAALGDAGRRDYNEVVLGKPISGFSFG